MVKKKHALALFPLALCFSSAHVLAAATTTDLEKRLQDQEKKITRLENQLKGTRSAVKENRSRISDSSDRLKINGFFSGGFTQNDGDAATEPTYGIGDNYSTAAVNKLGIQMTFRVSENIDATAQLVSKGIDDYSVEAEWAYLSYKPINDLTLRVGRSRVPYYLLSEYLDVGYAYPWVRPPIELYNIPLSSTDGLSFIYDKNVGPVNFSFQGYAGSTSGYSDQLEGEFVLNQQWGGALFAEVDDFTFRLGYNTAHLDVASITEGGVGETLVNGIAQAIALGNAIGVSQSIDEVKLGNITTRYMSAAAMYDNGSLLVMSEIANLLVDGNDQPAGDSGYLTVGYRFGKWMPHVTFAKFYTDNKHDEDVGASTDYLNAVASRAYLIAANNGGALPGSSISATQQAIAGVLELRAGEQALVQQQQSYTIGLTYDISSRVKAKLEATHYENFGSYDVITGYSPVIGPGPSVVGATPSSQEFNGVGRFVPDDRSNADGVGNHTAIYSFSIDAVF